MTTSTRRRSAAGSAPPKEPAHVGLDLTRDQLREAVRAVFYPRIPTWDEGGQRRVDRATDRLVEIAESTR